MKYDLELKNARELEEAGKNIEAAKLYEDIGGKCLREVGEERKAAPKLIGKSIARYLLAGRLTKAQDLAYQVLFMKDEDPFLSLQVETAISSKEYIVRAYLVNEIPQELDLSNEIFNQIPQNRKLMKLSYEITIKHFWEMNIVSQLKKKFELIDQKFLNLKEMVNFILSTKTGISIIGAEMANKQKLLVVIAVTFNKNPVEVISL